MITESFGGSGTAGSTPQPSVIINWPAADREIRPVFSSYQA